MKPRLTAYDVLPPAQVAVVHIAPPLVAGETTLVMSLRGSGLLVIDSTSSEKVTIRNNSNESVPYIFAVVPERLGKILGANWKALLTFAKSILPQSALKE